MKITIKSLNAIGLSEFIAAYKKSEEYRKREKQTAFCGFAKNVFGYLIKDRPNRPVWDTKDLTALIHILKCPQNSERFMDRYFNRNLKELQFPDPIHYKIMEEFRALPEDALGYTGVGLSAITKIDLGEVADVREFIEGLYAAKSIDKIKSVTTKYQAKDVGQVAAGIFSPWAHYLHPKICPITNSKSRKMLKAFGFNWNWDYSVAIDVFMALAKKFEMEDLGLVDRLVSSSRLRAGLEKLVQIEQE